LVQEDLAPAQGDFGNDIFVPHPQIPDGSVRREIMVLQRVSPQVALIALGLVLSLRSVAVAHHSTAIYDLDHPQTVEGTVKIVNWINPHVTYVVESDPEDGEPARTWLFETWSPGVLKGRGWTKLFLQPGDNAVFSFAPFRDGSPGGLLLGRHLLSQGRVALRFVENSGFADSIRENDVLFPLIESVHVLAICLVVGSILAVDFRLLGFASIHQSVSRVIHGILPLTWGAFVIAVVSGSLLFFSNATRYLGNSYFVAKILLICAAGLNMAIFHAITTKDLPWWENDIRPPPPARLAGALSIVLWVSVVACGRWIGFTMKGG
jgi:Family of unknown function (DUF6152)